MKLKVIWFFCAVSVRAEVLKAMKALSEVPWQRGLGSKDQNKCTRLYWLRAQVRSKLTYSEMRPCPRLGMSFVDKPTQTDPYWPQLTSQGRFLLANAKEKNYPVAFGCVAGQQLTNQLPSCWQGKGPRYHDSSIANSEQTWQWNIIILFFSNQYELCQIIIKRWFLFSSFD